VVGGRLIKVHVLFFFMDFTSSSIPVGVARMGENPRFVYGVEWVRNLNSTKSIEISFVLLSHLEAWG
jgi:hypothetical protein